MIKLSKTYEVITEESAEHGEAAETGFHWQDVGHSFTETVDMLAGLSPSQSPITDAARCWFTSYGDSDFCTGDVENTAIHYSRENKPETLKYWAKAIRAAGHKVL